MSRSVVFVDWHGVLSSAPFWSSILDGPDRDLATAVEARLRAVWHSDLGAAWMRGELRLWEIIKPLCVTGGRVDDRLAGVRRSALLHDCLQMAVHRARRLPAVARAARLAGHRDRQRRGVSTKRSGAPAGLGG